jgi:hypothetical protein
MTEDDSPPSPLAVLDRRYQLTLKALQSRGAIQYTDYKVKSAQWAALTNQSLCLTGEENKVTLTSCHLPSSKEWTIYQARNPDKRDHLSLRDNNKCIDVGAVVQPRGTPVILYLCHGGVSQELSYDFTSQMIYHGEYNNCLEVTDIAGSPAIKFSPCSLKKREQKWVVTLPVEETGTIR